MDGMINRVDKITDRAAIKNCIISVADKTGCIEFVHSLSKIVPGIKVYSTGGTFKTLQEGLSESVDFNIKEQLVPIDEYIGQPEMQGGLVKTLDYRIYAGILSEPGNSKHEENLRVTGSTTFDMIVVNLYPFQEVIQEPDTTPEKARSHIDIGGPCMLRAGAKNFLRIVSICEPGDYTQILTEMRDNNGTIGIKTRLELAKKAFSHTAMYDSAISGYFQTLDSKTLFDSYIISEKTDG